MKASARKLKRQGLGIPPPLPSHFIFFPYLLFFLLVPTEKNGTSKFVSFFSVLSQRNLLIAPYKGIQDSLEFWIRHHGLQIHALDCGFLEPYAGFQLPSFQNLQDSTSKNFPDSPYTGNFKQFLGHRKFTFGYSILFHNTQLLVLIVIKIWEN